MELNMEILPERIKLIQLQMTLLRALESHTLSQRQWKGDLPCVQITGYVSVCVQVWVIHSLFEWMTRTHRVHDIQIPGVHTHTHTYPKAWLGERGGSAELAQVQWVQYIFMSGIMLVCLSHREICLWHSRSHRLVPMIYVCLWFPKNMPPHASHFGGV